MARVQKGIEYIAYSKKGIKRKKNQDRIQILDNKFYTLFIVYDGVSSYDDSYLFIEYFKKEIELAYKKQIIDNGDCLQELLYLANKKVLALNFMGKSTISMLFISKTNKIAKYVNIGDSRIYIYSDQFLEKLTNDDSISNGNVLTRYLGSEDLTINDFKLQDTKLEYNFLICTDGFYTLMNASLKEFFRTLNFKYLGNIKKRFAFLQRNANTDDSTYILIRNEILQRG